MIPRLAIVSLLLLAGCAHTSSTTPAKPADSSAAFFHADLAAQGRWIDHPDLGICWYPTNVTAGWKPSTVGRWIYTDDDHWLWAGSEPWSWATDHYGHWTWHDSHGWLWSPSDLWSHNTVTWHVADDFIGWAPKPRRESTPIPPLAYTFVPEKDLLDPTATAHAEPATRNVTLLKLAVDSSAPTVDQLEAVLEKPVRRYHITDLPSPGLPKLGDDEIALYRPVSMNSVPELASAPAAPQAHNSDLATEQRLKLDDYHRQLRVTMDQRHTAETTAPPAGVSPEQLTTAHETELAAFEDQRQRDIESLRRRQRDEQSPAPDPVVASAGHKPAAKSSTQPMYDLPPEWQMPPEMLNTSPNSSPNSPKSR